MKIGFLGNANNFPFMLARAIRSLGHEVVFIVDSKSRLNRPENRYQDISQPYPSWIVDCSPVDLWQSPPDVERIEKVVRILQGCDALVLNEFGPSLWGRVQKPAFALLTGTDLEILADRQYADFSVRDVGVFLSVLRKLWHWRQISSRRKLREHLLRLIGEQRNGIRRAIGVNYFPQGMLPNADRLLTEIGVHRDQRVFFLVADIERYQYSAYPENKKLRLFNVARITWRKPRNNFICELDYKGTDVLIRGLGMFVREYGIPIEIRLVQKGIDLELARQLIEEEGLASSVVWLEEMDQSKLYEEYKNADIVTEHFGQGSVGMGALDALSVGRPVIANGSPEVFRQALGEAPPICHATTAEEIRDQLLVLASSRDLRERIGKDSRLYIEKYWTLERAANIIIEKLKNSNEWKIEVPRWTCPNHGKPLENAHEVFECPDGCSFPSVNSIPRFVPAQNYASSFGLQWNQYRTTQLDSHTGLTISRDRLIRLLGGSLDMLKGKQVLEAGCGAGRFSELLLEAGAHLYAVDLSTAVEANYKNCSSFPNYSVCQASILELPFAPEQFDIVICIGVIQHTPNPEQTMDALCRQVRPGGLLVIDHYTYGYAATPARRLFRSLLLKLPGKVALPFCSALTAIFWPFHRLFWTLRKIPGFGRIRQWFLKTSPIVDYHDAYPQLGPDLLKIWATLDTHDTLTDYYKHLRSAEEISDHLLTRGMEDIETCYAGNGVEVRARKLTRTGDTLDQQAVLPEPG